MTRMIALFLCIFLSSQSVAQSWYEPQRGTAERAAIMDAVRPVAEYVVGPPVQFVVSTLRVSGNIAFASLTAQRPGGTAINPTQTPAFQRGEYDPQGGTLNQYHTLLVRSAAGWVVQHSTVDATDVWWSEPSLCAQYRPVVPEVC